MKLKSSLIPTSDWTVYILKCADDTLYTGITTDINRRTQEHTTGRGAKYTKGRGPVKVVYTEICKDRSDASKREIHIKKLAKVDKLKLFQTT